MDVQTKIYHLLLVEDNEQEAKLTKASLEQIDSEIRVHVVHNGSEALQYFIYRGNEKPDHPPIDLVLLDLKMPKTDGMTVLNILKTNERSKSLPIIILSGSLDPQDIVSCYQSGASCYLSKPVNYAEFTRAIKSLVEYWRKIKLKEKANEQ